MRTRLHYARREDGFTLFELLVVIIILAILAGIVIFSVGSTQASGIASSCSTDAKSFQTALEEYKADTDSYPALGTGSALTTTVTIGSTTYGPFMRALPGTTEYQIVTDGLGGVFVYPAGTGINHTWNGMDNQTIDGAWGSGATDNPTQDSMLLGFMATNGAICNNPYLTQAPS